MSDENNPKKITDVDPQFLKSMKMLALVRGEMFKDLREQGKVPPCLDCRKAETKRCKICGSCICKGPLNEHDVCPGCIELGLDQLNDEEIDTLLKEWRESIGTILKREDGPCNKSSQ